MKILTFSTFYLPGFKGGGPIKTLNNLVDSTDKFDMNFNIVTADRDLGDSRPYDSINSGVWNDIGKSKVFYLSPSLLSYYKIFKFIEKKNYDCLYLNSFFSFKYSIFPQIVARHFRVKVILGPRGEFSFGALSIKSLKKNVFLFLYRTLRLGNNAIFQASCISEKNDIHRVLGKSVDTFIAEDLSNTKCVNPVKNNHDVLRLIFLSRISPMKNLKFALTLMADLKNSVVYDIYGPIEDHIYWSECLSIISSLPSNVNVNYKGEVQPQDVVSTLSKYDLFFMPTMGENFGHAIFEAFSAGLPVIISDKTPWRDLEAKGIGWDISLDDKQKFVKIIDELALKSNVEILSIRLKVISWVKEYISSNQALYNNVQLFDFYKRICKD